MSRVSDGLSELKSRFETHVHSQVVAAVEKCGEAASNVSMKMEFSGSGGGGIGDDSMGRAGGWCMGSWA